LTIDHTHQRAIYPYRAVHPFHAIFLGGALSLFIGALLADYAYFATYELQWKNFTSWLLAGGLIFAAITLLCALVELLRPYCRGSGKGVYILVLLAAWIIGFINALIHAQDAWQSMPTGLILSILTAVLMIAATALGLFARRGDL
jgi:uncharacterized membrane protein